MDYSHMAEKEKLSELQLRLKQLLNQVDQISKEQAYQRVSDVGGSTYILCCVVRHLISAVTSFSFLKLEC